MNTLRKKKKSGFTLVELLVVLIIIGIIVALILPNTLRAIDQAERRQSAGIIRSINNAAFLCFTQTRNWAVCDTLAELAAGPNFFLDPAVLIATDFNGALFAPNLVANPAGGFQANTAIFPNWPNLN